MSTPSGREDPLAGPSSRGHGPQSGGLSAAGPRLWRPLSMHCGFLPSHPGGWPCGAASQGPNPQSGLGNLLLGLWVPARSVLWALPLCQLLSSSGLRVGSLIAERSLPLALTGRAMETWALEPPAALVVGEPRPRARSSPEHSSRDSRVYGSRKLVSALRVSSPPHPLVFPSSPLL